MIKRIRELFRELDSAQRDQVNLSDRELKLVSATLMAEVIRSDGRADSREVSTLRHILALELGLDAAEITDFIAAAQEKVTEATSMFEFTDKVNRHFDDRGKFELVRQLWLVARADGVVHKLEEATIRKIAELIYLPHSEFIRAKQLSRC